jgi:hypothetical protein
MIKNQSAEIVRGEARFPPRCIITTEKEINLNQTFDQKDNQVPFKPLGLWYSIRDSYIKFINFKQKFDNDSILPKNLNIFKLTIYPKHLTTDIKNPNPNKILQLKTYDDVKLFNKIYKTDYYKKPKKSKDSDILFHFIWIDWVKVAKDFGGIEFHPYIGIHTKLFDEQKKKEVFLWYSQIEYDSGCIWNLKNIVKNIEKISSK